MAPYGTYPKYVLGQAGVASYIVGYPPDNSGIPGHNADQPETLAIGYKSVPYTPGPVAGGVPVSQRQVTWEVIFSGPPTTVTVLLEGSLDDVDGNYQLVDTSTGTTVYQKTVATDYKYVRVHVTALTGSGTFVVKIKGV